MNSLLVALLLSQVNFSTPSMTVASGGSGGSGGSVTVSNFPSSQAVTGTLGIASLWDGGVLIENWPATQAVTESGAWSVSVSNFPATAPSWDAGVVIENFPATQPVSGSVSVSNFPVPGQTWDGGVLVENFPATQAITGTVTANDNIWDAGILVLNFPASQTVAGTVAATQSGTWSDTVSQATAASLNATVVQATAASLNATVTQGAAGATAWLVSGKSATNSAVTNPIMVALKAQTDSSAPSLVTAGNQGQLLGDTYGRAMVQTFHPNHWTCNLTASSSLTQCEALVAASSIWVTDVIYSPTLAGTLTISNGTGTNCGTTNIAVAGPWNAAAATTLVISPQTPIKLAASSELCVLSSTSSTITISGFIAL